MAFTDATFAESPGISLERMRLIQASQELQAEQDAPAFNNKLGLFVSNYGTAETELNPGLRYELSLTQLEAFSILFEGIYFRTDNSGTAFISAKLAPLSINDVSPYLGAGGGIIGRANYQVFAGIEVMENLFIEAKYINEEGSFDDSDLYLALGYQIRF